jgi:dephospho-CoA kinase
VPSSWTRRVRPRRRRAGIARPAERRRAVRAGDPDARRELDRPKLASIVFADPPALADLEAIVHPEVRRMIADGIQENLDADRVVVLVNRC